jgi:hypothetical protein
MQVFQSTVKLYRRPKHVLTFCKGHLPNSQNKKEENNG